MTERSPRLAQPRLGPPERANLVLSLLSQEVASLDAQVIALMPKMDSFVGLVVAAVAAAITLGASKHIPIILVLLPFVLLVIYASLVQQNTELLSRAGHKRALEQVINAVISRPEVTAELPVGGLERVLVDESHVSPWRQGTGRLGAFGRTSIMLVQALMAALLMGAGAGAITHLRATVSHKHWESYGWGVIALFACGGVAGIVMLVFAYREQRSAYRNAYVAALRGLAGAVEMPSRLLDPATQRDAFEASGKVAGHAHRRPIGRRLLSSYLRLLRGSGLRRG